MITAHNRHYLLIWLWLLLLVIVSVAAALALPKTLALVVIFAVAATKAFLVARHYMHLKNEKAIIYAMVLIPLTFVLILLFGLFPDFVYR
jgi:caa(3)-type oxidase subunit IV